MLNIYYDQILFLIFQCIVVAFLLLTLFRLRTVFGLSLLLTALGVFQYMQVFLANALYFEIIEGVFVSSGSSVLFTGSLFAILLVYIKEDTQEARKLIYAILSANIVLSIIQVSITLNFESERVLNIYNLPKELFHQSFRISIIGAFLLFIDTFLIIFMYELISKYTKSLFFRILIATIFILSIDSIVFAILGFYGTGQTQRILISGLISKNFTALVFTIIFSFYLKFNEKRGRLIHSNEKAFKDIFHTLTFRQKYEQIYEENITKTKEITDNEKRFKTLVEQATDAYFVHDFYGNFIDVNERACKSLGYTRQEILTMNIVDIELDFNLEKAQIELAKIKPNEPYILYGKHRKKNGEVFPVEINFGCFSWKDKNLYIAQARDITVRIQKELEIKRYVSIVETSTDLMAFLDKNFTYLAVNNSYVKAFNLDKNKIIGSSVLDIFGKDFFEETIKPEGERCLNGEYINYKKWFNFPGLGSKYMDIRYSPFYNENNKITGFNVNARDITKSKIAEDKLIIANTIVNRSSSVAFLWKNDAKWPIEFVSENVFNLCGYTLEEFMEQKISYIDLIHPDDIAQVQQEVLIASENSATQKFIHKPYRIISKNDEIKWVQDNTFIRRNPEGIITHYEGIVFDITDKINSENKLKEEKNKTQNYLDVAGVMLVSINANGIVQMINPKGCEILGYTEAEILGKNWFDNFIPKTHLDKIKKVSKLVYEGEIEQVKYFENEILTKDGNERLIAWTNVLILDDNGNVSSTLSSGEDITERKELETALLNEKTQLKAIIDNIPVMITLNDPNINTLFLNNEFEKKLGITTKEAAEINIMEVLYPDKENREQAADFYGKSLNEWKELQITSKSGELLITEWTNVKLNNGIIIDIGLDITEKKKTQAELNKTKDILLNTLENMTDGFVSLDLDWNYNYVNKKAGEFFGRTPSNLINKNIWKEFPEGIDQPFYKNYFKALETQKPIIFEDYYPPWDEWYENRIIPSQDGLAIFFQDITERKNNEKALIEFNNRLKILHDIDSAILNAINTQKIADNVLVELKKIVPYSRAALAEYLISDDAFNFISIKSEIEEKLPQPGEILISNLEFLNKENLFNGKIQIVEDLSKLDISFKRVQNLIKGGLKSLVIVPLISENILVGILVLGSNSMEIFTENSIKIINEIGNQLAIVIQQNKLRNEILKYTEDLEEKIVERTEQLEFSNRELRDFAQIVSHDLKAPLRAISQLSYWISQDYSDKIDDAGKEQLEMLIGRVKRLDNLIEGILQYSRAGKAREKEILMDLNVIVNEVINSLNPPKNIEITIDNKLPKILGDPTRFGQVFQNLIANAIKYNDKSKCIINLGCSNQGDYWEFYISDNGPGIEEKYFDRIFQIFQRLETRDNNEGTGVGLSLVKRIIQIYNGEIWITSKINEGATFHFTLPIKPYND